MAFIATVAEDEATGEVADVYEAVRQAMGYVPEYTKVFMARPDVYEAWGTLVTAVAANMDSRRYELVTLAAAQRLRSSYCSLAHGKILSEQFLTVEQLRAVVVDREQAGLDEVDVAVMDLAEKVADDALRVSEGDIERLRGLGLSDTEIADVVYTAAVRSFFSKTLDALGAQPDDAYNELPLELQEVLTVGRPIAEPTR